MRDNSSTVREDDVWLRVQFCDLEVQERYYDVQFRILAQLVAASGIAPCLVWMHSVIIAVLFGATSGVETEEDALMLFSCF